MYFVGWAQIQKVVLNHRSHSSWAGVDPPEHFEPNQRSVAVSATQRTASKVLASQYWKVGAVNLVIVEVEATDKTRREDQIVSNSLLS